MPLHGCFSRFLSYTNGTKLRKAFHISSHSFLESNWDVEDLRVLEQFFENKVKYKVKPSRPVHFRKLY